MEKIYTAVLLYNVSLNETYEHEIEQFEKINKVKVIYSYFDANFYKKGAYNLCVKYIKEI
ncbi:TPA: hypothetical protein P6Q16_002336 [Staphylococcus aureus]|nr:hypothetical protein [Staphylococcus aureus]HDP4631774.1 hypothetical protein [Staphylococcus aureus]